jgi:hypothetical protein
MAGTVGAMRCEVHAHVIVRKNSRRYGVLAPDRGPNSGQEFFEGERFAQIIIRAVIQPAHTIGYRVASSEEDDGCRSIDLAILS